MRSGFSFSRQSKAAYPFLTWMPKCARYQAAMAFGSRAFMNTPPMPVTFSISAAFLMLSCDEDRVDQRQPAAKSKAPTVINRSVFMDCYTADRGEVLLIGICFLPRPGTVRCAG